MSTNFSEGELKQALKAALIEVVEERGDLIRDLFEEALEDIALTRAIEEGNKTVYIERPEQLYQE